MSKYLKLLLILTILLFVIVPAFCGDYHFIGRVLKVKTDAPYPFENKDGRIWECKIKILYTYYDPEYGWIEVKYKAYPLRYSGYEWACGITPNAFVEVMAHSKSDRMPPRRGDIVYIHGLE